MRQSGIIAAGALYALENNVERLAEDHANAKILANAIRETEGLSLEPENVDTNMVIFRVDSSLGTAFDFLAALEEKGVLVLTVSPAKIRAVTHLDVTDKEVIRAGEIIQRVAEKLKDR